MIPNTHPNKNLSNIKKEPNFKLLPQILDCLKSNVFQIEEKMIRFEGRI